jgi:hypothetical protein
MARLKVQIYLNVINSFVGYNPNIKTYKGLVLRPSCVPEKVGINQELYSLKKKRHKAN